MVLARLITSQFSRHRHILSSIYFNNNIKKKNSPMGVESITMFRCGFSFLFLCICCLCTESSHAINRCAETERQALLKFKATLDPFTDYLFIHRTRRHALTSWKGADCCKWEGISCDNITGHVTSLNLTAQSLRGKINPSLCELQRLTSLDLSENFHLEGKIPRCIGSLGQLIELNLNYNELVGVIPPTVGNLSNLQTLDLGLNHLAANDLQWLSHLSNLRHLDLSSINLSRAVGWPSSITKIPSLSELYLYDCGLRQVNPKSFPHLNSSTSLKYLDLSGNELDSSILPWVLNVSKVLTYLALSYNSLHSIPDGLGNMTSLQHLDLSYNEIEGSIPKSFQSLRLQLKKLYLDSNKLSGKLSDNIQQLCCAQNGLKGLDLGDNPFSSGPLPDFSCFSSLEILSLRNANVVGPLPPSFGHLPSLTDLDLSHNQLIGSIPHIISQFSGLTSLLLSSNKLNGVIGEKHLSNLSRLQFLGVAENSLSFNLSSNWVPPFQLLVLYASSCILGPKFPTWLKHQRELIELQISNSNISGSFPKWFWHLSSSLTYLNVSHNELSGVLPKSLPSSKADYPSSWDFSFNNLSGPLPPFPELYALFLSNNMFSGSLSSFCKSSTLSLTYLDLSSNLLVGPLPDCWGKFHSLKVLDLAKNNLSEKIPNSIGTLRQMESLQLNNNNFSGEIPSLTLCSSLAFIDFGNNSLQGTLPAWIGYHLHKLIVLHLRANKFQGNIPVSLCNLSFLQVLDLSENNITGEIPQCFNHIIALSDAKFPRKSIFYLPYKGFYAIRELGYFSDSAILAWKGANREFGKNLGLMTAIDLSCNHLTGEIPQSIAKLVALAGLNLSWNNLTGLIPDNIGDMERLESLDLSRNHLYGRMPASFSNLTFLSYMNLSFNNLSGEIPLSTQLQSFDPSTYVGNNGLCGPPLINHCPEDVISPTGNPDKHVTNENEDEDELITIGFYVSLGLGFFVGFWGVCGTFVIKTSWRYAYFQFFKNMSDWIHVTLVVFVARMKRRFRVQD